MGPYGAVVLISGASSGIGAAAAEAFDRAGSKVAIAGGRSDRLESVAKNMSDALVLATDISRTDEARSMVERTVEHFGRIDVLINNPSHARVVRSDQLDADDIHAAMDANFIGPMAATQVAARAMCAQGAGHIINLGFAGYLVGVPTLAPYAASAAAISGWTRTMQAEWADSGVRVTEFFPGLVDVSVADSDAGSGGAEDLSNSTLRDLGQGPFLRWLARPQRPDDVAKQLVECVRNPRATVYSSGFVRWAAFSGLFARLRVRLGAGMARASRQRTGAAVFSPLPGRRAGSEATTEQQQQGASPGAGGARRSAVRPVGGAAPPDAVQPVAPLPAVKTASAAKLAPAARKMRAKNPAANKPARKSPAPRGAKRAAAKKVTALSPEATARVRAAAARAAASAKGAPAGGKAAAKTKSARGRSGKQGGGESADS